MFENSGLTENAKASEIMFYLSIAGLTIIFIAAAIVTRG